MEVRLVTPVCNTGYGMVGLNILLGLQRQGHSVQLVPRGEIVCTEAHQPYIQRALQTSVTEAAPTVAIDQLAPDTAELFPGKALKVLYTIFELDTFTADEMTWLDFPDHVMVCSQWASNVLQKNGLPADRLMVVPLGVDANVFSATSVAPVDGETHFFATGKFEMRKGYDFLAAVFAEAFSPNDPVRLTLHAWNPFLDDAYNQVWVDLFKKTPMAARVEISRERFHSQTALSKLMAGADCGVFLSRAEGWNLGLLEMMAMGKPVITTNYSGHTEFATPANALLVEVPEVEPAKDGVFFNGQGNWARLDRPQAAQAIGHLQTVHQLKQSGQLPPNQAGLATGQQFSWDNAAIQMAGQLQAAMP